MKFPFLFIVLALSQQSVARGFDIGDTSHDIIIVGAGSTGLYAARTLQSYGYDVLIIEATERIGPDGDVLVTLDETALQSTISALQDAGVKSLAVCLLHAYLNPAHERAIAGVIRRELPDMALSLSSDVSPELGEYERSSTTTANA